MFVKLDVPIGWHIHKHCMALMGPVLSSSGYCGLGLNICPDTATLGNLPICGIPVPI